MQVRSLGGEDPLEEGMATHSSILAWRIPWTGEPGGLQPKGHKQSDTTEGTHAQSFPLVQKVTQETCSTPHISLSRKYWLFELSDSIKMSSSVYMQKFKMLASPFKCLWGKEIVPCIKCKIIGGFLTDTGKRSRECREAIKSFPF